MVPRTLVLLALIAATLAEQEVSYDEYPVVVPKRAALVLDRLMVALQRALQAEQISRPPKSLPVAAGLIQDEPFSNYEDQSPDLPSMAMDRKKYITTTRRSTAWKCYFNVVTCFRKK